MHALEGWPQCWSCGDYQKPHLRRITAMKRLGTDMCLCTECRNGKVRCVGCWDALSRWAIVWRISDAEGGAGKFEHLELVPDAIIGEWRGYCRPCARRCVRIVPISGAFSVRRRDPHFSYPRGPEVSLGQQPRPGYRRKRRHVQP